MDIANCQETDEDADHSGEEEYHETEQHPQSIDAEQEETYFNAQGQDIAEFSVHSPCEQLTASEKGKARPVREETTII